MQTVFISSVITGFEGVRQAARAAVESVGGQALMFETAGASPQSSQRALLDLVARADIYLILLGARYGEKGQSGFSPTEDEFNHANHLNKPIIGLRQTVEMEPEQIEFVRRVGGNWEDGRFYDSFTDESDVALKVVKALTNLRNLGDIGSLGPPAQERAAALAAGDSQRDGFYSGGSPKARVAIVPLVDGVIIDAVALDDPQLPGRLSDSARAVGLIPHSLGIAPTVTGAGVRLDAGEARNPELTIQVGREGSIVVEADVTTAGRDSFASAYIDPDRVRALLTQATELAAAAWREVDRRNEVQHAAVALAITHASGHLLGRPTAGRQSISFGGSQALPGTVVVPQPASIVRRQDLTGSELQRLLLASVRRVFADADALAES